MVALVAVLSSAGSTAHAVAGPPKPEPGLYSISFGGQLVAIDVATGAATPVRVPLPPPFTTCDSLEFVDGWFYASYAGGRVVRFGFDCGDEVDLGLSGFAYIEAIARRGDGVTFAAVSFDPDVGAESVGIFDPLTGNVAGAVPSQNQFQFFDIDAMAFASDGSLHVINLAAPRALATFDVGSGAITNIVTVNLAYAGLTFAANGITLYGLSIGDGNCGGPTLFGTVNPLSGAEAIIGPTGFTCLTGLTLGPPAPAGVGDVNHDGAVNGADITALLGSWGPCARCAADLNCDGQVDGQDFTILLGAWTG